MTSLRDVLSLVLVFSGVLANADICTKDICEYTLAVERASSMTYTMEASDNPAGTSYDIELEGVDLKIQENSFHRMKNDPTIGKTVNANDVITGDGFRRTLIRVNKQFPGPAIEVMHGSQVLVTVKNNLLLEGTSVHWHGLHMTDTPWMDGVAMLTQCPIMPGQSYKYRFQADPPGTHWYHSHVPGQRIDGFFGFLVVHELLPRYPSFNVFVNDWAHTDVISMDVDSSKAMHTAGSGRYDLDNNLKDYMIDNTECGAVIFYTALINGRGRYDNKPYPLTEFTFGKDDRYRLRLINAGNEYAFEVSIDNHTMDVVALDGNEIEPITVTSFMLFAGETTDVEILANQPADRYWMRANILRVGTGPYPTEDDVERGGKAIIVYEGSPTNGDPTTSSRTCSAQTPCTVFNCPYAAYPSRFHKTCVPMSEAKSIINQAELARVYGLQERDANVLEYFINIGFAVGTNINARRNIELPTPIYNKHIDDYLIPCGDECDSKGCKCHHVQPLPYNKTIQLILSGYMPNAMEMAHHTLHLHGHSFAVLKMGFAEQNETTGFWIRHNPDLTCDKSVVPRVCATPQWTASRPLLRKLNPPLKDTILVPARGYVVVRFRTENPGYWMLHCHQEMHVLEGMAMTFFEATELVKPLPRDFPQCDSFTWTDEEYQAYLADDKRGYKNTPAPTPPDCRPTASDDDKDAGDDTGGNNKGNDNYNNSPQVSNTVTVEFSTTIGAAFGFLLAGAIIALIPSIIFYCCRCGKSMKTDYVVS